MGDHNNTVFISYRRDMSRYIARAIFMDLRYNGYDTFMDIESIGSGTFDNAIIDQIAARAHFVLVLTPGSLERCVNPADWLRQEIELAMESKRNIVPILVDGFNFRESERALTGLLAELPRYNGIPLTHDYFDEGMERLRNRFLKQPATFPASRKQTSDAGDRRNTSSKAEQDQNITRILNQSAQKITWQKQVEKYKVGQIITGVIVLLVKYGVFVRIEDGLEGLVHISEMSQIVKVGDVISCRIIKIEFEKQRIGLSMRMVDKNS